jgi:hypothetical protein
MDNLAEAFDRPVDSPEHRILQDEVWLGGLYVECRYYLGMLTGRNEFRATINEFLDHLTDYVTAKSSDGAAIFCCSINHCHYVVDFLRRLYETQTGRPPRKKETKEHKALELLLKHTDWTNEQIVSKLGATFESLKSWITFRDARRAQHFYEQRIGGWYYPRRVTNGDH